MLYTEGLMVLMAAAMVKGQGFLPMGCPTTGFSFFRGPYPGFSGGLPFPNVINQFNGGFSGVASGGVVGCPGGAAVCDGGAEGAGVGTGVNMGLFNGGPANQFLDLQGPPIGCVGGVTEGGLVGQQLPLLEGAENQGACNPLPSVVLQAGSARIGQEEALKLCRSLGLAGPMSPSFGSIGSSPCFQGPGVPYNGVGLINGSGTGSYPLSANGNVGATTGATRCQGNTNSQAPPTTGCSQRNSQGGSNNPNTPSPLGLSSACPFPGQCYSSLRTGLPCLRNTLFSYPCQSFFDYQTQSNGFSPSLYRQNIPPLQTISRACTDFGAPGVSNGNGNQRCSCTAEPGQENRCQAQTNGSSQSSRRARRSEGYSNSRNRRVKTVPNYIHYQ